MQTLLRTLLTGAMVVTAMLSLTTSTLHAAQPPASKSVFAGKPLAELRNPDGTLDLSTGYRGSLDVGGWRLASEPGQAPRFAPLSSASDSNWSAMGSGAYGFVYAIAVSGSNVYMAGNWTPTGVDVWTGSYWVGLEGPTAQVFALAVDAGGNLYAGGNFTHARNHSGPFFAVNRIVKRDSGTGNWVPMGHGVSGEVDAIATSGTDVYVGGSFAQVCGDDFCTSGTTANDIARWDGSWHSVGNGMNNSVIALAVDGSNLYAGGDFSVAHNTGGDVTVNRIAKWNGSIWSGLANGLGSMSESVDAIAVDSAHNVYAAGNFTFAHNIGGDVAVSNIAKWSGSNWSALGSGLGYMGLALAVDSDNNLYAGGSFSSPVPYIARWNGMTWDALGSGTDGIVEDIAVHADKVYVGGTFTHAGGIPANYIAQWTIPSTTYLFLPLIRR